MPAHIEQHLISGVLFIATLFALNCLFFGKPRLPGFLVPSSSLARDPYSSGYSFGLLSDGEPPPIVYTGESEQYRKAFMSGVAAGRRARPAH